MLILRGARVFGAARTLAKAEFSGARYGDAFVPLECNLAAPSSIRSALATLAQHNAHFDGIVANAGIMSLPYRVTACGAELQMLTNHLGHFLLVTELLDRLHREGRVVVLSSAAHKDTYREGLRLRDLNAAHKYHRWQAYGQSKLANILFVRRLARRLPKRPKCLRHTSRGYCDRHYTLPTPSFVLGFRKSGTNPCSQEHPPRDSDSSVCSGSPGCCRDQRSLLG